MDFAGQLKLKRGRGLLHAMGLLEAIVGLVGKDIGAHRDRGAVLGHGDGAIAGSRALAHFLVSAGEATRGLDEDVVVAAEIEGVFDDADQIGGGVFVFDWADEEAGAVEELVGFGIARMFSGRIDMNKPGRVEAQHAAVGLGEDVARSLKINGVGLEAAIDATPVNPADKLAIVNPAGGADELIAPKPTLKAGAKIFDAEKLDGAIGVVGEEVDDPLGRNLLQEIVKGGVGVEGEVVVEDIGESGHSFMLGDRGSRPK